jgi:hypothetical protein
MGIKELLSLFNSVKLQKAGEPVIRIKKPEGRLIWNSDIDGTYIRAKHGEIGSKKHD